MTTLTPREKTCALCGETNLFAEVGSSNRFGFSDLDSRPAEMIRSTLPFWVQCCPSCGYCAPDISEAEAGAAEIVHSSPYMEQRASTRCPELANHFLCRAFIENALDHYAEAGWAALHAAWACDDARNRAAAIACRKKAIELLRGAQSRGVSFAPEPAAEQAVLADLLRRSREFEAVEAICLEGLKANPSAILVQVLEYERALARRRDGKCYTVEQAAQYAGTSH